MTTLVRQVAGIALAAAAATATGASAQRSANAPGDDVPASAAVRAELAAVLLNSKRYAEAAREYGRLVDGDRRNFGYRLGLARALAWSERHREAETHLRVLAEQWPRDATVDALLRSVRAGMTPSVREAESWLAEQPGYAPYRLALARALVREGQSARALAHYRTLLDAHPTADLLRETADVRLSLGDVAAAETDLRRSIAISPTPEALLLLGDLRRWQGSFVEAREAYERARSLRPADRALTAAFAQLARDERPAPVAVSVPGEEAGTGIQLSAVRDNAGIDYTRVGVRRGFELRAGFTGSAGLEYRELREAIPGDEIASSGFAADAAVARSVVHGALYGSIGVRAGVVHHFGEEVMTAAGVAVRGAYQAWVVAFDAATGPAYPTLLTAASLMPPRLERRDQRGRQDRDDDRDDERDDERDRADLAIEPLRERRLTLSAGGPIGPADAAITWQRADISDGNRRSALTLSARYPLTRGFSAVYAGSSIAYAERSPLYWDPDGFLSSAAGLAYTQRRMLGLSFGARFLLGLARADESPFLRSPIGELEATRTQVQLNLDSELSYRRGRWEVAAAYAFGRVGPYQRNDATVTVRVLR
jgi:tetratricopeptide (TPR) repeat protein